MSFSKDPAAVLQDALQKNYARVRFQQGKPVLDRELNLLADLAGPHRLADQYLGNGVPVGSDGFRISSLSPANHDFQISAGRCLVAGHEVVLAASTTYKGQPVKAKVAPLPAGDSHVYLRVFLAPVTPAEDPSLNNSGAGDVGAVTSLRERVAWEVLVSVAPINARDHFLLAVINPGANTALDRRRLGFTMSVLADEARAARGAAATLGARLDASLDPGGALKPNVVGNAQLADASVGTQELADNSVSTQKLTNNSVSTQKLADNSVSTQKLADGAVGNQKLGNGSVTAEKVANNALPISKLTAALIFDTNVSLPPASQLSELIVPIDQTDGHAFHLISVRYVGPRPNLPLQATFTSSFNWTRRTQLVKPQNLNTFVHRHLVVFQNPTNSAITVGLKVYRLAEN